MKIMQFVSFSQLKSHFNAKHFLLLLPVSTHVIRNTALTESERKRNREREREDKKNEKKSTK